MYFILYVTNYKTQLEPHDDILYCVLNYSRKPLLHANIYLLPFFLYNQEMTSCKKHTTTPTFQKATTTGKS